MDKTKSRVFEYSDRFHRIYNRKRLPGVHKPNDRYCISQMHTLNNAILFFIRSNPTLKKYQFGHKSDTSLIDHVAN